MEIGIITRNSRQRILEAANELARDVGPGNLSLDAVAQRAGLSKGGLLYNFPTKAKLMEALVEMHISQHRQALEAAQLRHRGKPNALSLAVVDTFLAECGSKQKPASGVLAAIAEDPSFIEPMRLYQRELVARLKAESDDPDLAHLAFLAIEGLRCLQLFEVDAFSADDSRRLLLRMVQMVARELGLEAPLEPARAAVEATR